MHYIAGPYDHVTCSSEVNLSCMDAHSQLYDIMVQQALSALKILDTVVLIGQLASKVLIQVPNHCILSSISKSSYIAVQFH